MGKVLIMLLGTATAALLAGCQSAPKVSDSFLFFPSPPADPRVQFLTWASGADQVEAKKSSFDDWLLGEEPQGLKLINKPYGVAAHDGVVYVCDTKGLSLCKLDYKNKSYSTLGTSGPGRLRKPINVVIDPMNYKFVVDPVRKQVVIFGPDDNYFTAFEVPQPAHPVDVAIYENELYVLDNDDTCQIIVLDRSTGDVIDTIGGPGGEPGQFKIPNSLCVDSKGNLYVSDTHNFRIQKLTRDGASVWVRGSAGYTLGRFGRPRGIRAAPNDVIYVVDGATEIVQMFNADGDILMNIGGPGTIPGAMDLPSTLAIDSTSVPYFQEYVHEDFKIEYLLFVANQFGPRLINVYGFGSFPEGYKLSDSQRANLPRIPLSQDMLPGGITVTTQPVNLPRIDEKPPEQD